MQMAAPAGGPGLNVSVPNLNRRNIKIMKKTVLIITAGIVFMLSAVVFNLPLEACTNYLISRGASVDGSTMISYAADSHVLYGELYYTPAADHLAGVGGVRYLKGE